MGYIEMKSNKCLQRTHSLVSRKDKQIIKSVKYYDISVRKRLEKLKGKYRHLFGRDR